MTEKIQMHTQTQKKQRFFAFCGIVAPMLFLILVIVESVLRPGYSQTYNFVSDLGVGSLAILQNINFVIFGILIIIFSFGLRSGLPAPQGRSLKAGVWFLVIFGLGILFAGIFPEDYLAQGPHNLVSSIAFITIIAAQLLIWQGLKNADNAVWSRYRKYSLVSGLLSIFLLILLKVAMLDFIAYQGAAQKVFLAVPWIWISVTGFKLYMLSEEQE